MRTEDRQATIAYLVGVVAIVGGMLLAVNLNSVPVLVLTFAVGIGFVIVGDKVRGRY